METVRATTPETDDVRQAMDAFSAISNSLLASYEQLSARAVRVEAELRRANEELERKNEHIHQLDKMAALGTMAGGIAHEIRNPMNAIKGFAALLRRELDAESKVGRWAERICEGATEVDVIIDSMLTFAAPERLRIEDISSVDFAEGVLAAARCGLDAARADAWELGASADEFRFRGDRIKLRQALRNLVANGVDAQPDGGSVHLDLTRSETEVRFRVTDAGPGIPADVAQKALDPFFTTRARGSGLGLSLVHTIAQLHGGRLEISPEPAPRGGASVLLRIPRIPAS